MFLADYHTHSHFSPDGRASMEDMAAAAAARGIKQLCFTDHVDNCCMGDPVSPPELGDAKKLPAMRQELAAAKAALGDKIELRLGMELASPNHDPAAAAEIAELEGLDFIIGSIHNLRGMDDFYFMKYESEAQCRELVEKYCLEYIEIANLGLCSVLGHLGYTQRYMSRSGFRIDLMDYADLLESIFRIIIPKGIGIEINTSGLRDNTGHTFPPASILELYRQCGGEIITVGSDAHTPRDAGAGIQDAYLLMQSLGFRYVCAFSHKEPEFIQL